MKRKLIVIFVIGAITIIYGFIGLLLGTQLTRFLFPIEGYVDINTVFLLVILVGIPLFIILLSLIVSIKFYNYLQLRGKIIFKQLIQFSLGIWIITSVFSVLTPNQDIVIGSGSEGGGHYYQGRGFPYMIHYNGYEGVGSFSWPTAESQRLGLEQFRLDCLNRNGKIKWESRCEFQNIFSRGRLIMNIVFWLFISFLIAGVVILMLKKRMPLTKLK